MNSAFLHDGDAIEFFDTLLEASTEYSIIGKGLDGTILLWNEGARRHYGYAAEEVVGKATPTSCTPRKTSPQACPLRCARQPWPTASGKEPSPESGATAAISPQGSSSRRGAIRRGRRAASCSSPGTSPTTSVWSRPVRPPAS